MSAAEQQPAYSLSESDEAVVRTAEKVLHQITECSLPKIAVIGPARVGKSTFINSIRGLHPNPQRNPQGADQLAKTGFTSDCTAVKATYPAAGMIWEDVPGAGGNKTDVTMGQEYIDRFQLGSADAIIFMYTDVLSGQTIRCAQTLRTLGDMPIYFARNKVNLDCDNAMTDQGMEAGEAMKQIRDATFADLHSKDAANFAINDHVFLISAKYDDATASPPVQPYQKELQRLKHALGSEIVNDVKRRQVKLIMEGNVDQLIEDKEKECWKACGYATAGTALLGAIPIPGVGEATTTVAMIKMSRLYMAIFGIKGSEDDDVRNEVKGIRDHVRHEVIVKVVACAGTWTAASAAADSLVIVPAIGLMLSSMVGATSSVAAMLSLSRTLIPALAKIARGIYLMEIASRNQGHLGSSHVWADEEEAKREINEILKIIKIGADPSLTSGQQVTLVAAKLSSWIYDTSIEPQMEDIELNVDYVEEAVEAQIKTATVTARIPDVPSKVLFLIFKGTSYILDYCKGDCGHRHSIVNDDSVFAHSGAASAIEELIFTKAEAFFERLDGAYEDGVRYLVLAGHSLGGMYAMLLFYKLMALKKSKDEREKLSEGTLDLIDSTRVLCFGAPMAFGVKAGGIDNLPESFRQFLDQSRGRIQNFVNYHDPCPRAWSGIDLDRFIEIAKERLTKEIKGLPCVSLPKKEEREISERCGGLAAAAAQHIGLKPALKQLRLRSDYEGIKRLAADFQHIGVIHFISANRQRPQSWMDFNLCANCIDDHESQSYFDNLRKAYTTKASAAPFIHSYVQEW